MYDPKKIIKDAIFLKNHTFLNFIITLEANKNIFPFIVLNFKGEPFPQK
jgi:hypothetical protein